jgi:hypothetical protein
MTHNVISPPPIDALRNVYSITSSARELDRRALIWIKARCRLACALLRESRLQFNWRASRMAYGSSVADHLRVEVKHRCPAPNRYTWEIIRGHEPLPLEESRDRFGSWEGASQAGKKALERKRESVEETH